MMKFSKTRLTGVAVKWDTCEVQLLILYNKCLPKQTLLFVIKVMNITDKL